MIIYPTKEELILRIQEVNEENYNDVAMSLFYYQYKNNEIFGDYVDNLVGRENIFQLTSPVYLPIQSFKQYEIKSGAWETQDLFTSSGTTGAIVSKHHVREVSSYLYACSQGWEQFYGPIEAYCFLCLLPGYMEREGSSLIKMMQYFVEQSNFESGFYLNNHQELFDKLKDNKNHGIPTVLFGVSFGLMDFIEKYHLDFPNLIIMETGGMKGRREEMIKEEMHRKISTAFGVEHIHSEYGMTELFSQAYSIGEGLFYPSKYLRITTTEITDPLTKERYGKTGVINITDLMNVDTCAFIQTEDLGIRYKDGSFRLMGRLDQSDIRGCNLMVE